MFKMEGVWYVLEKGSNGEYVRAKFSKMDDSVLTNFNVEDRSVTVADLTFTFIYNSDGTTQVQITQEKKIDVIDRVESEWCIFDRKFDENQIIIIDNEPFDFQLSKIVFDNSDLPDSGIKNLGNGYIYDGVGVIKLYNDNYPKKAKLSFWNDIVDGYVVTKGMLSVPDSQGEDATYRSQEIGVVFGNNLDKTSDIVGAIDGRVSRSMARDGGTRMIVSYRNQANKLAVVWKTIGGPTNDCNAIWMSDGEYPSVVEKTSVGYVREMSSEG